MEEESEWISQLLQEHTPLHQESTLASLQRPVTAEEDPNLPTTEEGAEGVVTAAGVATPDLGRGHALTALGEVIIEEVNRTVKINDQIWRCYCRLKEDNFCQKHHPTLKKKTFE